MGRPGPLTAGRHRGLRVALRRATGRDADLLFEWRNDPDAVRFSVTGQTVSPSDHAAWISRRIADPGTRLWIAEEAGEAVGQVRVDIEGAEGTVSIGVAAGRRGRGLGTAILEAMVVELEHDGSVRRLRALVHAENRASLRAFERAGFVPHGIGDHGFAVMERSIGRPPDPGA